MAGELTILYRDRRRNRLMVIRDDGGKVVKSQVSDGGYQVPKRPHRRRAVIGTAMSMVILPSGRLAVAYQDASRLRIKVAIENAFGKFTEVDVPNQGRPQVWPRLLSQVDGTLLVAFLELDPAVAPPSGRISTWTFPVTAGQP